ncbi:MAG: flagellar biosynthesis anti-sigma factor FlgM [Thermotogota bacterium]
MIDSGGINRINSPDLYKQLKKAQNQQKEDEKVKVDPSLFKSENLEKSSHIRQMLDEAHKVPEVREKLVHHFQELIQNNAYHTDADKIVKKILDL